MDAAVEQVTPDRAGAGPDAPRRWRRLRLALWSVAASLLVLALVAAGVLTWTVRRSFPQVDGTLRVPGLHARVEVLRDRSGVPQIYADDPNDLFLAQGYVHAQDRFWEMDVRRHITAGRLSELFGAGQVGTDTVIRTMGWRRVAEAEIGLLSPDTRAHLAAYADGVNAYLRGHHGAELGVEYAVLGLVRPGYAPEPWTPADSVAWLKAMSWDLNGTFTDQIQHALLAAALPPERVATLFPGYDYGRWDPIVADPPGGEGGGGPAPAVPQPRATGTSLAALDAVLGPRGGGIGSNSWVVAGSRTTTGRPLLANDPHLAPSMPGIWHQIGLHCTTVGPGCPFDVAGFSFSGMPGVVIGHNADIAWGFTNLAPADLDLYLEKVTGDSYEYRGRQVPLTTRTETIQVAGGKPVTVTVRSTGHGPLVSDAITDVRRVGEAGRAPGVPPGRYAVAMRWTALEPHGTMDAVFELDTARDWPSFRAAAAHFATPSQNMVYADRAGHIGYQAPGLVPVRPRGHARYPVPGWTGEYDWAGYLPFEALPSVLDPAAGYVVTANNAAVGPAYPHFITANWAEGYRSQRIVDLLRRPGKLSPEDMRTIQGDTVNANAATLTPYLLAVTPGRAATRARDLLAGWDFSQPADSAPAAYFNAVWRHLLALTFHDELPADPVDLRPDGGGQWFDVVRGLLTRPDDPWWRNAADPRGLRTRDDVLRAALDDAAAELVGTLGEDPAAWRWGALHTLTLTNQTLGAAGPAPVRQLLNRGPLEVGGGGSTVDATGWDARDGYQVSWVPSMRMVVDLADLDASRWVNLTGASGHAFAAHYDDQKEPWRDGRLLAWPFGRDAVRAAAADRLALLPTPAGP